MIYESILAWRALILGFRIWGFQNWTQNEILDPVRFFRALKLDIWARLARKLLIFVNVLREICDFGVKFAILAWNLWFWSEISEFSDFRIPKFDIFGQKTENLDFFLILSSMKQKKTEKFLKPHFI